MKVKKVMVIGAGQMGGGIAQLFAMAGYETLLNDMDEKIIQSRLDFIEKLLSRDVAKGRRTEEDKAAVLARMIPSTDQKDAADCDLVVEAIVEKMEVKTKVFAKLDGICKPSCILASNTSSLSITEIAAATKRPEQVIGMHFMNPAQVMKLVELIRGLATSQETYQTVRDIAVELGKSPVAVRDVPGFISNRIVELMINEAVYCLYEGSGTVEDIDTVMKLGMNHPMGPLELADHIGIDTVLAIMETMHEGYGDSKYRPCPLLKQYVKAGWLGKKSGRGFYEYNELGLKSVPRTAWVAGYRDMQ